IVDWTKHSPLTTHHSPLTTHHSPLTTHHSPLTTHQPHGQNPTPPVYYLFSECAADPCGQRFMNQERPPLARPRCRRLTGVRVVGTGSYVPDAVVTNDHLHQRLGFDSEWIVKRTGIYERRHALPHQATSDLCQEAAKRCIEQAGVDPKD